MATEPKIYTKNYVNSDDTITVDSGSGSIANIYDRDIDSQWASSGANNDAVDVTMIITFYEGSAAVSRTIDTLLMLNHNIKAFDVYYWDGAAYQLWHSFTGQAATYTFFSLSSQTTSIVKIVFHTTQSANQEKKVGELNLMALQVDFGQDLYTYQVQFRQRVKDVPLGDGSLKRGVIRWTYNRIEKYEATWSLILATDALLASLLSIKQAGLPFLWYPESVSRPTEIWYVHWYDPRQYQYTSFVKGAGDTIQAQFKEV